MESISGEAAHHLSVLWEAKRGGRLMPARADFDVLHDLRPFLGRLILAEVIEGVRDWRYRVFGTTIAALGGEERQGMRLKELPLEEQRFMCGTFNQVTRSRRPAEVDHPGFLRYRPKRYKLLVLPLSDDGETVNMILALLESAGSRQATAR